MKLDDAIRDYLLHIKHERGLSVNTFKHYQSRLHNLQNWLNENGYPQADIHSLTTPVLRRFMYFMSEKGLRPRSIRGVFHAVRGLCAFLVEMGAMEKNPSQSISMPKLDASQRQTVSEEEIILLMEACERQRSPRQVALCRAVLSVLVYGGLRRAELCDLQVEDFYREERSLLIRSGKGSKSRKVFLCDACVDALQEWLALREKDCTHNFLFAIDRRRRVHNQGIASIVETVKAIAGLNGKENIKPHSLRHACATRLMRNGADLRSIQSFLGHSSLSITAQYLHTDEEQLKNIAHMAAIQPNVPQKTQPTLQQSQQPLRYSRPRRTIIRR